MIVLVTAGFVTATGILLFGVRRDRSAVRLSSTGGAVDSGNEPDPAVMARPSQANEALALTPR